jgi:YwiC-like protein
MAEHVTELAALSTTGNSRARLHSLIVPREHGAWGMLLVPLATGAAVGLLADGRISTLPLLVVATLAIFWMRTPLESWLGTSPLRAQSDEERNSVKRAIFVLAAIASVALAGLFWGGQNKELFSLGVMAALAFVLQAGLKKAGRKTRVFAQIVGAVGLTSTAPAAYCVVVGHVDGSALLLWGSNWLFAVNQIQFVQLRIHSTRVVGFIQKLVHGRWFLLGQLAVAAALLFMWRTRMLPGLLLLAFIPALVRGLAWFLIPSGPLVVRRLGWTELAHNLTFGILLVLGFTLHI